ncbi:MAG: hypothetical protein HOA57_01550 [Candidatus Magasanikbacteria bacterium]|jgi:hypothetical protein|nr:hypothetical protein [Candidatus Magasanikbacteria bacterium]MBT4315186.1 hypothetical protein [Candidatus Magasanikbacteria bacterium]MBT4547357.1 hypothetical protein [Candidatus Magasanikbacteria bacterium]MBT6819041.1 hypothetical protein [Candidatus Magasanikbacteria bacterium]
MKTPLYREALSHSWQFAKEHKILWVFGLFSVFLGQMGILELLSKVGMSASGRPIHLVWSSWFTFGKELLSGTAQMKLPLDGWLWFVSLMVVLVGFGLLLIFVSVVSQGALIKAAAVSVKHKKLPNAGEEWHVGVEHFWRMFFINLIKKVAYCLMALPVGYVAWKLMFSNGVGLSLLFLLVFVIAAFVGMVISFLAIYAAGYVVVEEYSFGEAWAAAWKLFTGHWLVSFEVGLITLLMNLVLALAVLFGMMILFLPTLISWAIVNVTGSLSLWFVGLMVGVGLNALFIMLVASVFSVFIISTWTYLFMKMHKTGVKSRVMHYFGK